MVKFFLACYFVLCCFIISAHSTCAGVFPPYATLPSASLPHDEMSSCCWFSENTCCGIRDEQFDIVFIQNQINDLAARDLSQKCYVKLASLMCFWCDPNTAQFVTPPVTGDALNPVSFLYLCPSFCDELFLKCFDDLGKIVNDFTLIHSAKDFCENFLTDNFFQTDKDLLPDFRIVVPRNDGPNCMIGIDDDSIITETDVCFPIPASSLVTSGHEFEPIVFVRNSATICLASIIMTLFILLILL